MQNRLMLCAGATRREGWTTLDAAGGDIVAIVPPLPPSVFLTQWDEIELIHGISSFYPWYAAPLLRDILRALAPGGKVILEQPDFNRVSGVRPEWVYGDALFRNPLHMNKWGYTPESLSGLLTVVGFSRIDILPAQHHVPERDFRIEAYK